MLQFEEALRDQGFDCIIGVDEAGRGPLAGPVVAAAVVLNGAQFCCRVDDSKKLSPRQREIAFLEITQKCWYSTGLAGPDVIDRVNILNATFAAMRQAVTSLIAKYTAGKSARIHVLVDGIIALRDCPYPNTPIVNGDGRSLSIAAASVVAKVTRDRLMHDYDRQFPQYGFLRHKGYPTKFHRAAVETHGPCEIHRKTFL